MGVLRMDGDEAFPQLRGRRAIITAHNGYLGTADTEINDILKKDY